MRSIDSPSVVILLNTFKAIMQLIGRSCLNSFVTVRNVVAAR